MKKVLIAYDRTGKTKQMAEYIAEGMSPGTTWT
jgi:flavodoxin